MIPVPVSDQYEHFYRVLYFAFGPCSGPGPIPVHCENTITPVHLQTSIVIFANIQLLQLCSHCGSNGKFGPSKCRCRVNIYKPWYPFLTSRFIWPLPSECKRAVCNTALRIQWKTRAFMLSWFGPAFSLSKCDNKSSN